MPVPASRSLVIPLGWAALTWAQGDELCLISTILEIHIMLTFANGLFVVAIILLSLAGLLRRRIAMLTLIGAAVVVCLTGTLTIYVYVGWLGIHGDHQIFVDQVPESLRYRPGR